MRTLRAPRAPHPSCGVRGVAPSRSSDAAGMPAKWPCTSCRHSCADARPVVPSRSAQALRTLVGCGGPNRTASNTAVRLRPRRRTNLCVVGDAVTASARSTEAAHVVRRRKAQHAQPQLVAQPHGITHGPSSASARGRLAGRAAVGRCRCCGRRGRDRGRYRGRDRGHR